MSIDKTHSALRALAFVAFAVLVYMQFRTHRSTRTPSREEGGTSAGPRTCRLFHARGPDLSGVGSACSALEDLPAPSSRASSWRLRRAYPGGWSGAARPPREARPLSDCARRTLTFSWRLAIWPESHLRTWLHNLLVIASFRMAPKQLLQRHLPEGPQAHVFQLVDQ